MNAKVMFGAVCVAAALFFLWPAVFGSWAQMRALTAALEERKQIEADRAAILEQYGREYEKLNTINATDAGVKFAAMVPVGKGNAEMVSAIQDIATTSGLRLLAVQIDPVATTTGTELPYRKLNLKLGLAGSYPALRSFLSGLEGYVRILNVSRLSVTSEGAGVSADSLAYELTAEAYFIK